jgi:hypothetical protein
MEKYIGFYLLSTLEKIDRVASHVRADIALYPFWKISDRILNAS